MAMKWIEFTSYGTKQPIVLNMEQASSIERNKSNNFTTIGFLAGQEDGYVRVIESVDEVLSSMNEN
jgi:hypothetical protein